MAESTADAATPKPGHNGYDPEKLKSFVAAHEEAQDQIDTIMERARNECKPFRAQQKELKNDCKKEVGVPKGTFSHIIRERKLKAKLAKIDNDLNPEEIEDADRVRHALGMLADLPLGQAAVAAAPVPKGSYEGSFRHENATAGAAGK